MMIFSITTLSGKRRRRQELTNPTPTRDIFPGMGFAGNLFDGSLWVLHLFFQGWVLHNTLL